MLFVLLGLLIAWTVARYLRFKKKFAFAEKVPFTKPTYPLIGCGHLFLGKTEVKRFWNMKKLNDIEAKFFRYWLGTKMVFGSTHPDIAEQVLTDPVWLEKPYIYEFFNLNYGLFGAKLDIWKSMRKALNPTFNMRILQSFIPVFTEYSRNFVERLSNIPEGSTVNMMDQAARCSLEMVFATTVGFDAGFFKDVDVLGTKIERFFYLGSQRILNVLHYSNAIYAWTKYYREEQTLRKYLDYFVMTVVKDASDRHAKMAPKVDDEEFRTPQNFVDELFSNKLRKFDQREIIENVYTILFAGTDTSSSTIAYICLVLGFYPDCQQKLYEEAVQVFPADEPKFTMESLKQLQYMEMVLKETLRLYPVAPMMMRESVDESTVNGIRIPKGSRFSLHIFNLHRRADVWGPDAGEFVPERFSPERSKDRHPFAFMAFSGGSRSCIGMRYAMMSMKIMMVLLVKRFRVKTKLRPEDLRFRFDAMLRLENKHLVQLEGR